METRPSTVWRALSVVVFVGMFGVSLVKAQGCQRAAQEDVQPEAEAAKPNVTAGGEAAAPAPESQPEARPDAGADAGADTGALKKIEVMPATKSGMVFPATKSGRVFPATKSGPVIVPDEPAPPQQQK